MSKIYDKTAASFKATTIDAKIVDAQKIMVWDGSSNISKRINLLDVIGDEKIDQLISDLSTYNRYETNYFSTNIENSSATVSSFRFGFKHFPHGFVKRVSLYGRNAITSNIPEAHTTGCYLMANVYKKDGTLVSSTSSTNKLVAQFRPDASTVVLNTWEFDNLVTPKEDEVIKFIPSPDGVTQVANYNLGILVDNYHTHEDCMCGGDDDFANNPLASGSKWLAIAIIEGDFIYDNENQNHFTDSTKHLNSVERGVIESLYTPTNVLAWDNNFNNETLGVASIKGFIVSRPYITNGKFKEVRWTSQGTANGTNLYIKITLRDTNGAPIKSYVSNNTESFNAEGLKSYRFNEEWEVDDSISSISFEPCNADGTIRTDAQIRVRVIGDATDNNSDGSESTNSNYRINVQFYKIGSVTNNFTSHVGDDTHLTTSQKNTISDCTNSKYTTILESEATESGEFDAVHFNYQDVPHDFSIKKFILKPLESSNTPLYMAVWTLTQSGQKTFVGLSDEAITWEAGKDAVWTFNNVELIVPTNHNVEFFLCTGADAVGETEADAPGVYIKTKYNPDGRGTIRHSNNWHSRCVQATFSNNGYLSHVGDDSHLTTEQKNAITDYTNSKNSFAAKSQVDLTYAKNATLFGGEHRTATGNDNTQSWSAVRIPSAYVPHLQPIHEIKLTTLNTNETTPMYLGAVAISDNEQQSQLLKLSTNSVTWTADSEVKWEFGKDGFIIPIGYQLELYLVANESDFVLPIPATDVLLQSSMNSAIGVGKLYPIDGTWGGPGLLDCILITKAHINNSDHLSAEDRELLDILANDDNLHILDTLNETIEAAGIHATGWFIPGMLTDGIILIDGVEYGSSDGNSYEEAFANYINSVETAPVTATVDGTRVILTAKEQGTEGTKITIEHKAAPNPDDDSFRSGETLTIDDNNYVENVETIKKIDFLSDADIRFAQRNTDNEFSGNNTFNQTIVAKENIFVSNGVITFEDLIEGTVVERSGASGYQYVEGIPTSFNNGVCYDIGEISSTTDLSNVRFSSENLVQTCELWFTTPATVPTGYKWPTDLYWIDSATGAAPTLIASKNYRLVFRREPNKLIASIAYLY